MEAVLRSNRGSESLSFRFLEQHDCGPDPGVDCEVVVCGSSWGDGSPRPIRADLGALHLSLVQFGALIGNLGDWLALPLADLATQPLRSVCPLAFSPPATFEIRFGSRQDTIDDGKPVVTIAWQIDSFGGEFHYVTDPSCLDEFAAGLIAMLTCYGYGCVDGRLTRIHSCSPTPPRPAGEA